MYKHIISICWVISLGLAFTAPVWADAWDAASLRTARNYPMNRKAGHLPYLIKAYSDKDTTVRRNVIRDLVFMANKHERTQAPVRQLLIHATNDPDRNIRLTAAFELAELEVTESSLLTPALLEGLVDPRVPIRRRSAETLAQVSGAVPQQAQKVMAAALDDGEPQVRVAVSKALRAHGLGDIVESHLEMIRERNRIHQQFIVTQRQTVQSSEQLVRVSEQRREDERRRRSEEDRIRREETARELLQKYEAERQKNEELRGLTRARMTPEFQIKVANFEQDNKVRFAALQSGPSDGLVQHWLREYQFYTSKGNISEAQKRLDFVEERQSAIARMQGL